MIRTIPDTAILIQEGLCLNSYIKYIGDKGYDIRQLYSTPNYCFYDKTMPVYDEEGNALSEEQINPKDRQYMQFASLGVNKSLDDFVSVKVEEDFQIV